MSGRNLADVLNEHTYWSDGVRDDAGLVADLLANGPAQHQVPCSTCGGRLWIERDMQDGSLRFPDCPDCTDGTQTVEVIARVVAP